MRNLALALILAMLASLAPAATVTTNFTSVSNGNAVTLAGGQTPAMTGTYSITGTFSATLVFQYSTDNVNWSNIGTYTTTQTALTFVVPGLYRWICTSYVSGTAVCAIYTAPHIYQQQFNNLGQLIFQVDDTGVTAASAAVTPIPPGNQEAAFYQGNVNNYFELQVQNLNSGSSASSDFVATANNGSATTHYVDMGINSSTGGAAPFTAANEAYVYSSDNILDLGAIGTTGTINLAVGATPTTVLNVDYANGVSINDVTTPSKKIRFNPSGATASTILTLADNQTTSQTLAFPNITGSDTLMTLAIPGTVTGAATFTGGVTLTTTGLTITDQNIVLGTVTGTKIGTATSQKLGFYNATPIVQPTGDVITALQNLGLVGSAVINASDGLDGTFAIKNTADNTKQFNWTLGNQTTGTTVTLNTGAQTASRTVSLPVLSGADTLMTLAVPGTSTGILSNSNATSATTSQTGAIVQNSGTAGTSVGIGAGNVNAGAAITAGTTVSSGTTMTAGTGLTITNGNATFNNTGGTENLVVNGSTGNNSQITFQVNGAGETRWLGNTTDCQLFDIVNSFTALGYKMGASTAGYFYVNDTLDAGSGTGAIVDSGGIYVAKQAIVNGKATLGGVTVPSANTFAGNIIWGRNNAAADTAGAAGESLAGTNTSAYTNYTTTATYQQVASVPCTAGKWHIFASGTFSSNASTLTASTNCIWAISSTTASATGTTEGSGDIGYIPSGLDSGLSVKQTIALDKIVNLSAATTYYLNSQATFTVGNPQFVGSIRCERMP